MSEYCNLNLTNTFIDYVHSYRENPVGKKISGLPEQGQRPTPGIEQLCST